MSAMTDRLENLLVDWMFRGQNANNATNGITGAGAAAGPSNLYIGLFTAAPSDTGGGTEVTGGSYARVTVASSLANWAGTQGAGTTTASSGTGGVTSNNNAITFPAPSANWGVVTHFGIFDASTTGNLLFWGALTASKTVNNGDPAPSFVAAALQITFA